MVLASMASTREPASFLGPQEKPRIRRDEWVVPPRWEGSSSSRVLEVLCLRRLWSAGAPYLAQ